MVGLENGYDHMTEEGVTSWPDIPSTLVRF